MRRLIAIVLPIAALASLPAAAQTMDVSPNGARPSVQGPAANFTGRVTVTPWFAANEHSNASAGQVEFTPGARSNWHTHPAGQTLIVTSGSGWVQQEGGERIAIKPGDVISTPPGVKHWHGATATSSMTHIAVTPMLDGKNVDWLEPVSDAQYQ
jgi:quercetin dioxygenase-like cupin family protein